MTLGIIAQATGLFTVTNVDDIVVLALFFAQGSGHRGATRRIVIGQYPGIIATVAVAVAASIGATRSSHKGSCPTSACCRWPSG